jgi:excisionase family DNA binding protein
MSELLTLKEGAKRATVSFPTFRRWMDRGEFPIVRIGRVIRVRAEEIDRLLEARTVRAGQ